MLKQLHLALGLALLAAPVSTQDQGMTNRNAPTCTQSIKFADGGEIMVSYKAITWASGKTMAAIAKEGEAGDAMRERINNTAAAKPLGSVKTTTDLTMSGRTIKAGEYDMFFTAAMGNGNLMWLCNLRPKGQADAQPLRWRLALEPSDKKMSRLTISLQPGEEATEAGVQLAFGEEVCSVGLSCAKPSKDGDK